MLATRLSLTSALALGFGLAGCATSSGSQEEQYNLVRTESAPPPSGGLSPEKEGEIQLVLQQRDASTRRCYNDELSKRLDRKFQGTVKLVLAFSPGGQITGIRNAGGSLGSPEVESCLIETIKGFEFPKVDASGEVQYEYLFRPAY